MAAIMNLPKFSDLVVDAIAAHSDFSAEQLIIPDNSAKYSPEEVKKYGGDGKNLLEIFELMASLNQAALEKPDLCAGNHGPSFRDTLFLTTGKLAMLTKGRSVRFVELGPEPWKSRAILAGLLAAGMQLKQYIGVDINPESEKAMRQSLVPLIGADRFSYWIQDFYKASAADFPRLDNAIEPLSDCVTVVANLGFQEGNDLPSRIGSMLSRLTQPGDLLLSEMQVLNKETGDGSQHDDVIEHFYLLPDMRRFSAVISESFNLGGSSALSEESEHHFILAPLETEVGTVNVASTLVGIENNGIKQYVVTNSCLKYTPSQFHHAREASGQFAVREVQMTGDTSVVFQISQRC